MIVKPRLKSGSAEYWKVHEWVKKTISDPKKCEHCGTDERRLHWANISRDYLYEVTDWMRLCPSCHQVYDHRRDDFLEYCARGHKRTPDNMVYRSRKDRVVKELQCRVCDRIKAKLYIEKYPEKAAKRKARIKAYHAAHRDKWKEYNKKWYQKAKAKALAEIERELELPIEIKTGALKGAKIINIKKIR